MIDLEKLTPAPWILHDRGMKGPMRDLRITADKRGVVLETHREVEAEFVILARNAFDVMMRRGWMPCRSGYDHKPDYGVVGLSHEELWAFRDGGYAAVLHKADPFTALVEADAWYKANVEECRH